MLTKLLDLTPERRDAILNAALEEFSAKGYDNASTNVIAKEAGISKALMFHYVSSKQELFLVVYDYFSDLIKKEYHELMNYDEKDIFDRLRQSYLLQIKLSEKYPWILEFNKLLRTTNSNEVKLRQSYLLQIKLSEKYPWILEFNKLLRTTNSNEVNEELENRTRKEHASCYPNLFDEIDEAKFREGLDLDKCKQLILWANVGFTNELLEELRNSESPAINYELVVEKLDGYLDELRKVFYASSN